MSASTREQFIEVAARSFAQRGFYGTSIAAIAKELGFTKQALLHHFSSKEKLYGEVLESISRELLQATREITAAQQNSATQVEELVVLQYRSQMNDQDGARLIMRELLDNEQRAEKAGNWYLRPYLDILVDTVLAIEATRGMGRPRALALIYQLLGAAHYYAVSQPTLDKMLGKRLASDARDCFEQELRQLIRARLHSPYVELP